MMRRNQEATSSMHGFMMVLLVLPAVRCPSHWPCNCRQCKAMLYGAVCAIHYVLCCYMYLYVFLIKRPYTVACLLQYLVDTPPGQAEGVWCYQVNNLT